MDKSIHVYAGWMNDEKIGILYQDVLNGTETISFEYSTDWIKHHPNLILDPTMKPVPFRFYHILGRRSLTYASLEERAFSRKYGKKLG